MEFGVGASPQDTLIFPRHFEDAGYRPLADTLLWGGPLPGPRAPVVSALLALSLTSVLSSSALPCSVVGWYFLTWPHRWAAFT